jgi:hypothetical protein
MAKKAATPAGAESANEVGTRASGRAGADRKMSALQRTIIELQQRDAKQEQQMRRMTEALSRLSQMSAIENILTNGIEELSSKLAPLAEIGPNRVPIKDRVVNDRLASLVESTARPSWSGATTVAITTHPVPFIGEIAPPPREKGKYKP